MVNLRFSHIPNIWEPRKSQKKSPFFRYRLCQWYFLPYPKFEGSRRLGNHRKGDERSPLITHHSYIASYCSCKSECWQLIIAVFLGLKVLWHPSNLTKSVALQEKLVNTSGSTSRSHLTPKSSDALDSPFRRYLRITRQNFPTFHLPVKVLWQI